MPKITEITYSRGETRQIFKEYQPTSIHYSGKAEVLEGEDIHEAYAALKKEVDEECAIGLAVLMEPQKVVRAGAKLIYEKAQARRDEILEKHGTDPF